jgi:Tfp pilus assembly protein FimV
VQRTLARLAAPAGLLLAVTIAVVLVRPALRDDAGAASPQAAARPGLQRPAAALPPRQTPRAPAGHREFYEIQAGDTLGVVASRYETTVEALAELNPGIDPVGLQVGQRIRVK